MPQLRTDSAKWINKTFEKESSESAKLSISSCNTVHCVCRHPWGTLGINPWDLGVWGWHKHHTNTLLLLLQWVIKCFVWFCSLVSSFSTHETCIYNRLTCSFVSKIKSQILNSAWQLWRRGWEADRDRDFWKMKDQGPHKPSYRIWEHIWGSSRECSCPNGE